MSEDKKIAEQQEKKSTIPRGPAATAAKNKYRDNNYDRAELAMPKGMKEAVREIAKQQGQSFNEYVCVAIKEKAQKDTGEELAWEKKR
ncbi:MAG: hypothetical protein OSJ59_11000 [Lachnospiraceae bacterium]|nr:hypothetical protein [Lachnospiraceae bacterium]